MERFAACFAELEDPREDNARHALNEILMIALCAMLCGAEDCSDMALFGRAKEPFLRQFLQLRHGIPSHDTFSGCCACLIRHSSNCASGVSWKTSPPLPRRSSRLMAKPCAVPSTEPAANPRSTWSALGERCPARARPSGN